MNIYAQEKLEKNLKWEYFLFMKKCENLTLRGLFIIGVLFKTRNRLHPIFFGKLHLDNLQYTIECFS